MYNICMQEFIISIDRPYGSLEYCFQSNVSSSVAHVILRRVKNKLSARQITALLTLETLTKAVSIFTIFH